MLLDLWSDLHSWQQHPYRLSFWENIQKYQTSFLHLLFSCFVVVILEQFLNCLLFTIPGEKKIDFTVVSYVALTVYMCCLSLTKLSEAEVRLWHKNYFKLQICTGFNTGCSTDNPAELVAVKNAFSSFIFFFFYSYERRFLMYGQNLDCWPRLGSHFFKYLKASNELRVRKTVRGYSKPVFQYFSIQPIVSE